MSEPVRAQVMRSSVEVTRKPLSASSSLIDRKYGSVSPDPLAGAGVDDVLGLRSDDPGLGVGDQSHSRAPFFHS